MAARRFTDDAFPLIVAHRGASSTHPENTLPSFRAAIELGASAIELDVRLTADGVAVVMHDPEVSRTTEGSGFVHELSSDYVRALNAGTATEPAGVPTLGEVLELASGRAGVAIEIKDLPGEPAHEPASESTVRAALAEVERTAFDGPVLLLSFDPQAVALARVIAPDVATGILTPDLVEPHDALAHVVAAGHDFVLPGSSALLPAGEAFVAEAHTAGVRVGTWTVDDPSTLRTLLTWGVDAIASNDPETALAERAAIGG